MTREGCNNQVWRSFQIEDRSGKLRQFEIRTASEETKQFILSAGAEMLFSEEPCGFATGLDVFLNCGSSILICAEKAIKVACAFTFFSSTTIFYEFVKLLDDVLFMVADLHKSDFTGCEKCMDFSRVFWMKCFEDDMTIACYEVTDGVPEVITGFNVLKIQGKTEFEDDEEFCKEWDEVMKLLNFVGRKSKPFQVLNVDKYLSSAGLYVLTPFRCLGIAAEMLKARKAICEYFGLDATVTVFTAEVSQRIASKCGFQTLSDIPYVSSELKNLGLDFGVLKGSSCKMMGIKYFKGPHNIETDIRV